MRLTVSLLIIALGVSIAQCAMREDDPPDELFSPDKRYSVKMLHTALPGSGPYGFFTLTVRAGDRVLSEFPTIGYLIDAFWSPDGRYVAVDNRRGNSGDYLWVFSLTDGHAIKKPVDAAPDHFAEDYKRFAHAMVKHVTVVFPELTNREFNKLFTFAMGWSASGDLQVKTNIDFRNLPDQIVAVSNTYKIVNNKLVLLNEKIEKAPWPPPRQILNLNNPNRALQPTAPQRHVFRAHL